MHVVESPLSEKLNTNGSEENPISRSPLQLPFIALALVVPNRIVDTAIVSLRILYGLAISNQFILVLPALRGFSVQVNKKI